MALIYKKQKLHEKYADTVDLVLKILKTKYGKYHKDILRLNHGSTNKGRENILSIPTINTIRSETDL